MSERLFAVVPAAGRGRRMAAEVPKQYLALGDKPVLQHTLERLLRFEKIERLVVVLAKGDPFWPKLPIARHPKIITAQGGQERADSVLAGLLKLADEAEGGDWVLVHDAARPLVEPADIERLWQAVQGEENGALLALPVADTLKEVEGGRVARTLDRNRIWRAQTPQLFRYGLLRQALEGALAVGRTVTDEASAIEWLGKWPKIVEGSERNLKITRPEDLELAALFSKREGPRMRIGIGYDAHRFKEGDHIVLGGVKIPFSRGIAAHSDGDVILHALCDALLGALALGDIGHHFPDSDPKWKGASSRLFLRHVRSLLDERGFIPVNVDVVVIAQAPKLAPYIEAMRQNIADDLWLALDRVSVKATTTEGMGFEGRGEGIAAYAVVLIEPL